LSARFFSSVWVVRPESVNDPRILKFISIDQHSPAVRRVYDVYQGGPGTLILSRQPGDDGAHAAIARERIIALPRSASGCNSNE
jgi:hypothetical protein